jgi:hypothetical protein
MLRNLEQKHNKPFAAQLFSLEPEIKYVEKNSVLEEELKKIDLNSLTPLDALNTLFELKKKI